MHRPRLLAATLALVALALLAAPAHAQIGGVDMFDLGGGVWAAIRANPVDEPAVGNSLIIINEEDVVVVDAALTPSSAAAILREIRKRTSNPVRYLVMTHWHDDHVLGAQTYLEAFPGLEIIAHSATRAALVEGVMPDLETNLTAYPEALEQTEAQLRSGVGADGTPLTDAQRASQERFARILRDYIPEMRNTRVVLPTVLVDDALVLHRGQREIRIRWMGRGNTAGDLIVHLPAERIVATGDLVVAPTPFALGSFIGDWIGTLGAVRALGAEVLVPGHGPVMRDTSYADTVVQLLESVRAQVADAVARGLTLEETRRAVDLETFRARLAGDDRLRNASFRSYFVAPAVERAWREARGELGGS
jgi:cyclase